MDFLWSEEIWSLWERLIACLLYTSDAADEEDSVDLGGRRIYKKKKKMLNIRHELVEQKTIQRREPRQQQIKQTAGNA